MGGAVPWQSSTYILVNEVEESATVCRVEEVAIGSEARATLSAIASLCKLQVQV